jgi:hypothetical protein
MGHSLTKTPTPFGLSLFTFGQVSSPPIIQTNHSSGHARKRPEILTLLLLRILVNHAKKSNNDDDTTALPLSSICDETDKQGVKVTLMLDWTRILLYLLPQHGGRVEYGSHVDYGTNL